MIKEPEYHEMQAYLVDGGYVFLKWPKGLSRDWLDHAKELVNFQLDIFREQARKDDDGELEFQSWAMAPAGGEDRAAPHRA